MPLDLSGLDQFRASALLEDATGKPLELPLDAIDFDPEQPRTRIDPAKLAELADNIKEHGVVVPISVRQHPSKKGRYIVNMGERRVRAALIAKLKTIPSFMEENCDPYAQASENVQREDLAGVDLAAFIAKRERAGDSRATIARKLGKPRSFITEIAGLIDCPSPIRKAYDEGRISDTRVMYQLVRAYREDTDSAQRILAGKDPITRERVEGMVSGGQRNGGGEAKNGGARQVKLADALMVDVDGRKGRMGWKRQPSKRAEVVYEDGERATVELARIRLISWSTR